MAERKVVPGKTTIFVEALVPGGLTAYGELTFTAQNGNDYVVTFKDAGRQVNIFVYNERTRKSVANVLSDKERCAPASASVPIFIPIVY